MRATPGSELTADLSNRDPERDETWDKRLAWLVVWSSLLLALQGTALGLQAEPPCRHDHDLRLRRRPGEALNPAGGTT